MDVKLIGGKCGVGTTKNSKMVFKCKCIVLMVVTNKLWLVIASLLKKNF